MSREREALKRKIEAMQDQLNKMMETEEPLSKNILEFSKKLDTLIMLYLKGASYPMDKFAG